MPWQPTYAIRCDPYNDDASLWWVRTIIRDGLSYEFGHGSKAEMEALAADLSKLKPETIARLVGDK